MLGSDGRLLGATTDALRRRLRAPVAAFVDRVGGTLIFPFFALYITDKFDASRLLVGIGQGSPGGWTVWPPHEHGDEKEELYVYFDMGAAFGGGSSQTLFGSIGASSFLSRLTTAAAVVFMLTSLALAYFSGHRGLSSVMSSVPAPPPPQAEGTVPGMPIPTEQAAPEAPLPTEQASSDTAPAGEPAAGKPGAQETATQPQSAPPPEGGSVGEQSNQ